MSCLATFHWILTCAVFKRLMSSWTQSVRARACVCYNLYLFSQPIKIRTKKLHGCIHFFTSQPGIGSGRTGSSVHVNPARQGGSALIGLRLESPTCVNMLIYVMMLSVAFAVSQYQNQKYFIYLKENSVCNRSPVNLVEMTSMYAVQIVAACSKIKLLK